MWIERDSGGALRKPGAISKITPVFPAQFVDIRGRVNAARY